MNLPQIFNYHGKEVRTVIVNSEPWWVAKDVCEVLGLEQVTRAMSRLDEDEKGLVKVTHPQNAEKFMDVNAVNEAGLYQLIMASNKTEAKEFKRWITREVLPSIRKHGAYMTSEVIEQTITSPDFIIQLATRLKEEQAERQRLFEMSRMLEQQNAYQEQQLQLQAPRVAFANLVIAAGNTQPMGTVAKAVGMGRTTLFKFLREKKVIMQNSTIPYQYFIDRGYFVVREVPIKHSDDRIVNEATARVTAKGLEFIAKLVMEERGAS